MSDLFGDDIRETRKNFSRNNLGQRREGDFYQTPPSMTRQFLDEIPVLDFPVLEPAAGFGALSCVLAEQGGPIVAYDILPGPGIDQGDFLEETRRFPEIITNPPFSLALEFILKCKEVAERRFSLLMPIDYLHGLERFHRVYSARDDWCLAHLHIYVRRAMMSGTAREDGKYETGMITWGWYTWIYMGDSAIGPRVHWIDNDAYVIRGPKS
jgi:hypothetical protein